MHNNCINILRLYNLWQVNKFSILQASIKALFVLSFKKDTWFPSQTKTLQTFSSG